MVYTYNPTTQDTGQKDHEFRDSLNYTAKLCLQTNKQTNRKTKGTYQMNKKIKTKPKTAIQLGREIGR